MKFTMPTQELNYLISKCHHVIPAKAAVPVLANFLIEAKNGLLTITANDLTVGIRCSTEAKIIEEGVTTLPAKRLTALIRELTVANVEISVDANHMTTVVAGSSRFKIMGKSAIDYSLLPSLEGALCCKVDQKQLREQLQRTGFAVSREDSRYALTGVQMHISKGLMTFTGTDGKRLARSFMPVDVDPQLSYSCIIPFKTVDEVIKNLNEEGSVTIYLMSDKMSFEANQTLIVSQLLVGEYPEVDRFIPQTVDVNVALHRDELARLLRQVSLFTEGDMNSVRFSFAQGELQLSANSMDIGEGKVSMPANYHGQPLDIAFNPQYFLDILRHCKEETVFLGAVDAFTPGVIIDKEEMPAGVLSASPVYVLMPMRLTEV